jgi:hypothetical protein
MPITLADVETYKKGLTDEQKADWLQIFNAAAAAYEAAGVADEEERQKKAQLIASSRVDTSLLSMRVDDIYEGEWPTPGKGAPRNPYGGFSSLDYPEGKADWLLAWKAHFAQVKDAKVFSNISEWLWAIQSALEIMLPDGMYDVAPREEDFSGVNVLSSPKDYGLKTWKDRPEGMSLVAVVLPSELELYDLHRAYWAERKRKEIDGLLSVQDAVSQRAWKQVKESSYSVKQLAAAVPKACLAWAKAQAKVEKRDLTKADLKLRYKNPDGTVNINGIRAALSRLPNTKLPEKTLNAAKAELEKALKSAKKALGIKDRGDAQIRQSYGDVRVVRYDEDTGILVADVPIAKMTVLPYLDADGKIVHELKHPRDFASPAFLSTVPGKPVVDGHRPDGSVAFDEMGEKDRAKYTCGVTSISLDSVWVEDSLVWAREAIFDKDLIASIKSGEKVQVSTGIWAKVRDEEGVYDGLTYQRRQLKPVLDHLAHVPQGRCGPDCSVVIDGAIEITETHEVGGSMAEKKDEQKKDEQEVVRELKLDEATITLCPDVTVEDAEAFQAAIDALTQAKADAEAATAALQAQLDAAKGEGDGKDEVIKTLQDELQSVRDAQTQLDEGIESRLDERIDMIAFMRGLDAEYDHHGKTVQQMRVDALKHFDESFDPTDLSEEYVKARFDTVQEFYQKQQQDPTGSFDLRAPRTDEEADDLQAKADARTVGLYRDPLKQGKKD